MNEATVYNYKPLSLPVPVTEQIWPEETVPLVSISCTTYNHENYIREAIDSFLMQKTTFPVRIIIFEDFSTDQTIHILKEYEAKYPQLFRIFYMPENTYGKAIKYELAKPFNVERNKANYIAKCEGDDYWTDPLKLQKQVDFLEANPHYVITYHDFVTMDHLGPDTNKSLLTANDAMDNSREDLIFCQKWIKTLTMCYRNVISEIPVEMTYVKNGDTFLISLLGNYGKGKWMDNIEPAVHRIHVGGVWSLLTNKHRNISLITTQYWISQYYHRIEKHEISKMWFEKMISQIHSVEKMLFKNEENIFSKAKRYKKRIDLIENSKPYKIGRLITAPGRYLKSVFS